MKKLLIAIAILFSVSTKAQDTSYHYNYYKLYRCVNTQVTDTPTLLKYNAFKVAKRKRKDRTITIVVTTIFAGITAWYFSNL